MNESAEKAHVRFYTVKREKVDKSVKLQHVVVWSEDAYQMNSNKFFMFALLITP